MMVLRPWIGLMGGGDFVRPGNLFLGRAKGGIGAGNGLGMQQSLAVESEIASLPA